MTAIQACIGCAHYRPDYVDDDGDTYGSCGLDDEIIAMLPANWAYCPRERIMPDAWEQVGCKRWKEGESK
ncbi:hypothetical protein RCKEEF_88 [Rhodobacter phage RcKeef]|nr:hypothetical protein RCIROH_87 [Rhodobacter phage RcIroh]QXN72112.1 hypothetical protein RCPUTIN_87 [Rhodobacter phage RcPutin]QXN72317.1 hypothetical protein RCSALEM_89 [Rhodobacter phage RcSalem]UUV43162.1 hypothetical protein RCBIGEAGLE_90 [Rhodobacter phage RcBigEagle]UUV43357.1 hypothetical protein RCDORA_88 [Rhodobacter phage RcDora]UUV43728.1 hypothetical protein RCKEEF_88 [Rhodobacter phage RcKeef]UUV44760.1 hypothetical protein RCPERIPETEIA_89 [Rhodobacter phage RcPeripeteia]UUV4